MGSRFLGPATVVRNAACAEGFFFLRLEAPGFPDHVDPGQFVHLRLTPGHDPLLRRPLSICDFHPSAGGAPARLDLLYEVVGRGTALLSNMLPGARVSLLGPQGRGFRIPPRERTPILVGGGVGIPPLLYLVRRLVAAGFSPTRIRVLLGARTAAALCLEREISAHGARVAIATDDGSRGRRGFVTALLEEALREEPGAEILACGPTPMLKAIAGIARAGRTACQLSLENRMGCALGACRACVCPVHDDAGEGWHYETVCRDGPVFDLPRLVI